MQGRRGPERWKKDRPRRLCVSASIGISLLAPLSAQPVVPAKAGLISYTRGTVYLDSQRVAASTTRFVPVPENGVVRTAGGRAEVLLGPCAVLRIDEDSTFRLVSNRLIEPRVDLLAGSAVMEIAALGKDVTVRLALSGVPVAMARAGLYRFDFSPPEIKVFDGRASVERTGGKIDVSAGRMLAWDAPAPEKFDTHDGDALDLWSRRRSLALARSQRPRGRGGMAGAGGSMPNLWPVPDASQAGGRGQMQTATPPIWPPRDSGGCKAR